MTSRVTAGAKGQAVGTALAALVAVVLAACSSVGDKIGDTLPVSAGGLPAEVPARSATQPDFVPVGETPPHRDLKPLTEDERKKLEADLVTLRDRQEGKTSHSQVKPTPPSASTEPQAGDRATDEAANR